MTQMPKLVENGARSVSSSVEDLVGGTPLFRLSFRETPESVRLLAKLEMYNPMCSVKDRAGLYMLRDAERTGLLKPGGTVVEYSSGNTGISLAGLCAARGHPCVIVLPDNATAERRRVLRAYGAEIVESPHEEGLIGAVARAEEVQRSIPGSWLANQSWNEANVAAHFETTGPEIWDDCGGQVDVYVAAVGTGGTLTGVAHYLKKRRRVHVVAVEPARSPVLSGGQHSPHRIPGVGGGFISGTTDVDCIDEVVTCTDEDAHVCTREIAASTGLLAGVSSGAATYAARMLSRRPEWAGATIVTIFPDSGERYLSMWDTLTTTDEHRLDLE